MPAPATSEVEVFLADPHDLVREGLRALLAREPGLVVVGEESVLTRAADSVSALDPDVVVVRVDATDSGDGLRLCRLLSGGFPLLALSQDGTAEQVMAAIKAGAQGYLLDGSPSRDLLIALRRLAQGLSYLDPAITSGVLGHLRHASGARRSVDSLTPVERAVLSHVGEGLTNKEIALRLGLPTTAVKRHVTSILAKLDVRRRTQAAVLAARPSVDR